MAASKSRRKASSRASTNTRTRTSARTARPSRRALKADDSPEASPQLIPLPIGASSTVLAPDSQPSPQSTLRNDQPSFPSSHDFGSQSSFSNAAVPTSQPPSMAQIRALLDHERGLANQSAYTPDAASMWGEATRMRDARLANEAQALQPRVAFNHVLGTNPPSLSPSIVKSFPAINRRYFTEIFRGQFQVENLHKLSNDFSATASMGESEASNEPKGLAHVLKCFEPYCQIVLEFASQEVYRRLQFAMAQYRLHLYALLNTYTFESVIAFHKTFVYARICEGHDNPEG